MYKTPVPNSKKINIISTKDKKKLMVFRKITGFCKIHNKCEYIILSKTETLNQVNILNAGI
jgi:hypothetical protein